MIPNLLSRVTLHAENYHEHQIWTVPGADVIAKRTGAKVIANGEAIRGI